MNLAYIWAKTDKAVLSTEVLWHPLILHMLDVAACAEAILEREPQTTRERLASILGLSWEQAKPWLLFIIACHDLGKACPGFQLKWPYLIEQIALTLPKSPQTNINHAFVSQLVLAEILRAKDWPAELADLVVDAAGCHHGERCSALVLQNLSGSRRALGNDDWHQARLTLADMVAAIFSPTINPNKQSLTGPDFMLLAGLTSFADWIGSNKEWFPFGTTADCEDLPAWFEKRRANAEAALDAIGWQPRSPLATKSATFFEIFNRSPRPLQSAVAEALPQIKSPAIMLIEAPMGEGKTEAAFLAHLELQRSFGHRGMYIALPTKATGNAMFERTLKFLRSQAPNRKLDLQLLHGAAMLNESFQNLRLSDIHDPNPGADVRAAEWFTSKKRALLSEYGVGTVDQAILPILPVRHNFVRLWGLANRVVIFDEIHAYDAYTGTLILHLLNWLIAMGSSIVLLSATLPLSFRRKIAQMMKVELLDQEAPYPRLTIFNQEGIIQKPFATDPKRRQTIYIEGIPTESASVKNALDKYLPETGLGLALVNTVQRAQDLYRLFPEGEALLHRNVRVGKQLADGTEIYLFHARFTAEYRQIREDGVLNNFGPDSNRNGRKILIATQVAEQSLDLDFDLLITDLAPIDLLLQRAGRLWRHARSKRPEKPLLLIAGLTEEAPPAFDKPLWWSNVYREDVLIRTWCLLRPRQQLVLPDEIDSLVQAVYEEQIEIPHTLQVTHDKARIESDRLLQSMQGQAHRAIIGLPDDASWNDSNRFVLYDEDEPGIHRTLMAQTRLGDESVIVVPLYPQDDFKAEVTPDLPLAMAWYLRAINVSRISTVKKCQFLGVPCGWTKSSLLRNCYPLCLDDCGRWKEDETVRLNDDLGLVYETKEDE